MGEPSSRILASWLAASLAVPPGLVAGAPVDEAALPVPATAEATSGGWWPEVQANLRKSEYAVTWQERTLLPDGQAAYQAPNRSQNLRTYFTAEGVRWVPRTEAAPWQVGLTLTGVGAGRHLALAGEAKPEAKGNRVEYRRGEVTEWYVNDERGVEQGFTVAKRPVAAEVREPLRLALSVSGNTTPRPSGDGRAVEFLAPGGALALRYADLTVVDARERELASRMEIAGCETASDCAVHLVVQDAGAAYPLTIDPLATSPNWTTEGNQIDAFFGTSVASAGDVNGDGYADLIVGAPSYDNGQLNEGRAYLYLGSASGPAATANWIEENNQADSYLGTSVGTAGDVDGDGYADVVVGAPEFINGQTGEGRAYVYHGSASGLSATPNWTAESNQLFAAFGYSVGTAGDVNRDGYADVIVGAQNYVNPDGGVGRAYVFHGSASGLSATPNWTAEGKSVGTAGDVNRDGYADVIVGTHLSGSGGRAYAYHGSASGLSATPNWTAEGGQAGAYFGYSVGTAGDVNGDGFCDVIVGAPLYDAPESGEGLAFVYHGSSSGLSATASWVAQGNQTEMNLGYSVATAGDVNGDGYADVIVGVPRYANGEVFEGRVEVYQGSAAGLSATATWTAEGNSSTAQLGHSVATAGDVNGDGYTDVIVGAYAYDNGQTDEGRALVYYGSASGPMWSASWTAEGDQVAASFSKAVGTAGDVNGDGYTDVIVGAPDYDNGQSREGRAFVYHGSASGLSATPTWTAESNLADALFGTSVATVGDVNGDGYADVIVGAPYFENGQAAEGRAFVYHGSASGLAVTPSWTAESDQAYGLFAISAGTAGDVNGDGYADVIIGAPYHDNGQANEGRAYVYQGSASGLAATPSWTAERNQSDAFFGRSVGTAGDVNGDGFADVIVGAPEHDNGEADEGRAYVYLGSAFGLAPGPAWTQEGEQASAFFGHSVASAGDVNGDGYADVIVGAYAYDNGQNAEGRAFAYHGSASGLSSTPNWTAESNQLNAYFGYSVGTAGDVNGDGYADAIVGEPELDEGQAYVYHGSASGLQAGWSWSADSSQLNSSFGRSVGAAGDVNGDGFADVIVGAPAYDGGETSEGRAYLYYGNADGTLLRLRQVRSSGRTVQPWGASWDPGGFQVRMTCSSPLGFWRVRGQVEACPNGKPLGDATCVTSTSPSWVASGTLLAVTMSGLTYGKLYHWRARTLYAPYSVTQPGIIAPPNPAHGPWRRPFGQAMEADLRVLDPDLIFADGFDSTPLADESADGGGQRISLPSGQSRPVSDPMAPAEEDAEPDGRSSVTGTRP